MFRMEDNTFKDLRERSLMQWLEEMEAHEDMTVHGGVRLCREYIQSLKDENQRLKEQNQLTQGYLKKMAQKSRMQK